MRSLLYLPLIWAVLIPDEFKSIDFKQVVKKKNFKIYDLRNIFTGEEMKRNKINYYSIGRPDIN